MAPKASKLDALKEDFVHLVSHELKTPLTSILGSVELLSLAPEKLDGEQRALVDVILRGCRRLQRMIEALLEVSRLERGRLELNPEEVDLAALSRQAAEALDGTRVELRADPGLPAVKGDRARLREVLDHLLRNALQYSPAGSKVTVTLARRGRSVEIGVQDHGMGLAPEERRQLFRKFYRSEGAKRAGVEGAGLGLAIVKNIVALHRGRVRVSSAPGKGSRFVVTLPHG